MAGGGFTRDVVIVLQYIYISIGTVGVTRYDNIITLLHTERDFFFF